VLKVREGAEARLRMEQFKHVIDYKPTTAAVSGSTITRLIASIGSTFLAIRGIG